MTVNDKNNDDGDGDMVMMIMKRIPPRHDSFVLRALLVCSPWVLSGYSNLKGAFTPRGPHLRVGARADRHVVRLVEPHSPVCANEPQRFNRACDTWQAAVWAK